jgi:hypothetical protein
MIRNTAHAARMLRHLEAQAVTADKSRQLDNVVAAIEAFVTARVNYELSAIRRPDWPSGMTDVDETREHLRDKLAELVT